VLYIGSLITDWSSHG